ncbi:hypothetical protein KJ853_00885 [Patescibacteria group bacterium]|nr:hypothetical protein [Patescibacteria group bacterium]
MGEQAGRNAVSKGGPRIKIEKLIRFFPETVRARLQGFVDGKISEETLKEGILDELSTFCNTIRAIQGKLGSKKPDKEIGGRKFWYPSMPGEKK